MLQKIQNYIRQEHMLEHGDRVVVGISGGADSVCLLLVLKALQSAYGLKIQAVHVEHGIRGAESVADQRFVQELCREQGVPCVCRQFDVPEYAAVHGLSVEEAGRRLRYETFEQIAGAQEHTRIAVAHNRNDQAETVLWNLIRGSGIRGMCGIPPVRGRVIRPLMCVERKEIEDYLEKQGQVYRTDSTNQNVEYTRNVIRHQVLPVLCAQNDQAVAHIAQNAQKLRVLSEHIRKQKEALWDRWVHPEGGGYRIDCALYQETDTAIAEELIYQTIVAAAGSARDIGSVHVERVAELFGAQVGKRCDLPNQLCGIREYDSVCIHWRMAESASKMKPVSLSEAPEFTARTKDRRELPDRITKKKYTKCIDYDKIENRLCVRTRRNGDYFVINSAGQTQKLKQYFINEKIPKQLRDEVLLVADGSHIVWIVGYRMSAYYYVTEATKKVLEIQYCKGAEDE